MTTTRRGALGLTAAAALAPAAAWAGPRARPSVHFVDAGEGDDRADGRAPATAWRTLARAARAPLAPGDTLLLAGGAPHRGPLVLTASGTPARPITVGSYGPARALIDAGDGDGVRWTNAGGIAVEDLEVVGSGLTNRGCGVRIENTRGDRGRLAHVRVRGVHARGFGHDGAKFAGNVFNRGVGVFVGGAGAAKSGFRDVRIADCEATGNAICGILVTGPWESPARGYTNADVEITGCRAWEQPGLAGYAHNWSGSGILLDDTDGGRVAHCAAWRNGRLNPPEAPGGPCGIWTHMSRAVTIEDCHSWGNVSAGMDGAGFDFDAAVIDGTMRRCRSHDNQGAGYLVYSYKDAPGPTRGLLIEDCVSERDASDPRYAGVYVQSDGPLIESLTLRRSLIVPGPGRTGVRVDARRNMGRVRAEGTLVVAAGGTAWAIEGDRARVDTGA